MTLRNVLLASLVLVTGIAGATPPGFPGREGRERHESRSRYERTFELNINQDFRGSREQTVFLKQELLRAYPELRRDLEDMELLEVEVIGESSPRAFRDDITLLVGRETSSRYSLSRDGRPVGRRSSSLVIQNRSRDSRGPWQLLVDGDLYIERVYVVVDEGFRRPEPPPRPPVPPRPEPPRPPRPEPVMDRFDPIGYLDTAQGGMVTGWSVDQDNSMESIMVHIYVGGAAGRGGVMVASGMANAPRRDLNDRLGIPGNHGFAILIPAQYRGQTIFVHGIDSSGRGVNALMTGSGMVMR